MKFSTVLLLAFPALISALPAVPATRGNVSDTVSLGSDESGGKAPETVSGLAEFQNWGITVRGSVPDVTNLTTDIIPASNVTTYEKRETLIEATDRLLFDTDMSTFLYDKSIEDPADLNWTDDGCSDSPDEPAGYNFLYSCMRHDFGYRNYKAQSRFTSANRLKIDNNFKADLYDVCATYKTESICKGFADVYYEAVRALGGL